MFAFRVEGVEKRTFSYSKHAPNLSCTLQMLTRACDSREQISWYCSCIETSEPVYFISY